ncbi:MAG: methyl-accepting chemotaxis protein [Bryobacteraceae bacterium]
MAGFYELPWEQLVTMQLKLKLAFAALLLLLAVSALLVFLGVGAHALWIVAALWIAALSAAFILSRRISRELGAIAVGVREGSAQVASAAVQLSSASQSLAQGVSTQASSLTEASGTSELMASIMRQTAESTRSATSLMVDSGRLAEEVTQGLESLVRTVGESDASAQKISRITKVIDEIAFQTNILALNAAVEAARAGEAGAGFAVVADEVRSLALRCGQAAKDISGLIEDTAGKAREADASLDAVAQTMRSLIQNDGKIKELVEEVTSSSDELARGTQQISETMRQLEDLTQKTAANSQQTAATSQQMSAQAVSMQSMLGRLESFAQTTDRFRGES